MAYGRRGTTQASRLSRYTASRRPTRRRNSLLKVRYQPPTARNQRKQIMANTRQISRNTSRLRAHKVYTDWQLSDSIFLTNAQWHTVQLTDFSTWDSVLRQDPLVDTKSHTFIKRMQLNMRYALNEADFCGFSVFVVTLRKNAASYDPFAAQPVLGRDWIEPAGAQGFNLRLNPAIFHVHYARYLTLTNNGFPLAPVATAQAGNPNTTWSKGQINIPLNLSVTQPALFAAGGSWKDLSFDDLPFYAKYYLMLYPIFTGTGTTRPAVSYDALSTCINAA